MTTSAISVTGLDLLKAAQSEFASPLVAAPPEACAATRLTPTAARLMIIDDEPLNIRIVRKYLQQAGYEQFVPVNDARQAVESVVGAQPDVILLDLMMPHVSGMEILREIRQTPDVDRTPVIILTADCTQSTKLQALDVGATDFLGKPVDPAELVARVRNALVVKAHADHLRDYNQELEIAVRSRTLELLVSRLEIVHCLARAAEFRDDMTGRHVRRVGKYVALMAKDLGMSDDEAHLLELAAQLHDVGKIGVPDAILRKPGPLTSQEYEVVKEHCDFGSHIFRKLDAEDWGVLRQHTDIGFELLSQATSPLIKLAARVALTHHERWDGTGYPAGLAGEEIPIEGRMTAVADVFDALSVKRHYKPALPLDECFRALEEGRGTHFDPRLLDSFFSRREQILEIQAMYCDADPPGVAGEHAGIS
jgi:putative two-component system response regulator